MYRYDINSCSQTKDVLELVEGFPMRKPKYGVPVLSTKRMNFHKSLNNLHKHLKIAALEINLQ